MSLVWPQWPAPIDVVAYTTTRETSEDTRPPQLADAILPRIRQVHGATVLAADRLVGELEADALITTAAGIDCRVVTADCLPILLCHREGEEIGAVHAGWRGLAAGVLEAALDAMQSQPDSLLAWIGPAISQSCYEVGGEVREAFLVSAPAELRELLDACFAPRNDKFLADLAGLARVKLAAAGVLQVYGGELCTYSDETRFHSWRRDGEAAGRIATVIYRRPRTG